MRQVAGGGLLGQVSIDLLTGSALPLERHFHDSGDLVLFQSKHAFQKLFFGAIACHNDKGILFILRLLEERIQLLFCEVDLLQVFVLTTCLLNKFINYSCERLLIQLRSLEDSFELFADSFNWGWQNKSMGF